MCHRVVTRLTCEPSSVGLARRWAADRLAELYDNPGESAHDVALVVSELVTNCVRAGAHGFELALEAHHASLRVAATDDAQGLPTPRAARPDDGEGRGLLIVGKLAADWGVEPAPPGKTVWAELPLPDHAVPVFDCANAPGR